jgi:hypothetical protein
MKMIIMTMMIINKNNKENVFNDQFVFIFVNYNTPSKHQEAKEKSPDWHDVLNMSLKLLKLGFRTYGCARTHTGKVVTDNAIEEYRGEDIQLHSFFTSALWRR